LFTYLFSSPSQAADDKKLDVGTTDAKHLKSVARARPELDVGNIRLPSTFQQPGNPIRTGLSSLASAFVISHSGIY